MTPEYIIPIVVGVVLVVIAILVAVCVPRKPCSDRLSQPVARAPSLKTSSEIFYRKREYSVDLRASRDGRHDDTPLEITESTPVYSAAPFPGNKSSVTDFGKAQEQLQHTSEVEYVPEYGAESSRASDVTIELHAHAGSGVDDVIGSASRDERDGKITMARASPIGGSVKSDTQCGTEVEHRDNGSDASGSLAGNVAIDHVLANSGEIYALSLKSSMSSGRRSGLINELSSKTFL